MENLFSIFKTSKDLFKNQNILKKLQILEESTSKLIRYGLDYKIPLDTYSNSYNYWLSICSESLPANLIQAQREFFGSHGYSRIDKGLNETFNSNWENK
jgi:6-phosphogluconate dehydrogenase